LAAAALTPQTAASAGDHDILLSNRLGLIFAPVVGVYLAWLQRSWVWVIRGIGVGLAIGAIFMALTTTRNFLLIMLGLPTLLGGAFAALLGSNESIWDYEWPLRMWKGLLAGLCLGVVYTIVLSIVIGMFLPHHFHHHHLPDEARVGEYILAIRKAGPVALGVGGALFFNQIRWAVGLKGLTRHQEQPTK
jgi:hypothetical protein